MPVSPALTADEQTALAGISTLKRYLSPIPDTIVATARVNQGSFTYPLAQLTVDGTSNWTDVQEGQTVYIGSTSGAHDKGIFRVRSATNPTTLFIGEVSSGDPGQLPQSIRTANFADNDYVTVVQRWDIWSILPVINPVTGLIYEDFNLSPSTFNTTPPALVYIYINGRRNHLFDYITTSDLTITATASAIPWPTSGASSQDYLWTVPSEWTGVSGDTTDTLTATAPPGNYVLYLTVTDSVGGDTNRVCYVNVHDADNNPPLLISEMPRSDTRDRAGRRMAFDLYDDRLASLVEGAAVGYFEVCGWGGGWVASGATLNGALNSSATSFDVSNGSLFANGDYIQIDLEQFKITGISTDTLTVTRHYNGTSAAAHTNGSIVYVFQPIQDVPTATRQFIGWVQQNERVTDTGLRQATIELIGPAALLQLLNSTSQIISISASPTTWQQAVASLCSASFMAWYMLKWRTANLLRLFNFTVFDVDPVGQRLPSWQIDKGTIFQQIQQLVTERGNFGANSEGEFFFLRFPSMVNYADRSGIVTRDSLTIGKFTNASITVEETNRVQQIRGEAFSWDGSATSPTPYYADAPKSPGQGTSQPKLASQVLVDQDELNQLTGDYYARLNNRYPSLSVNILKNRDVYEPAELPFIELTIPAQYSPDGIEYQGNGIPLSINKRHNSDGTSDIELQMEGETHGNGGVFVPVPIANPSIFVPPTIPNINVDIPPANFGDFGSVVIPPSVPSPQEPDAIPGKAAIRCTDGIVYRTYDVTVEPPTWDDVTPTGFVSTLMVIHSHKTDFSREAYVLGNDGSDSFVAHTDDIYATTPIWTTGGIVGGIYTKIVSIVGSDALEIISPSGAWCETIDFTASDGGFSAITYGTYSGGVGWIQSAAPLGAAIVIEKSFASTIITSIEATMEFGVAGGGRNFEIEVNGAQYYAAFSLPSGVQTLGRSALSVGATSVLLNPSTGNSIFDTITLTSVVICGVGSDPFGVAGTSTRTAYSADGGTSWDTPIIVGTSPSAQSGFDVSSFGVTNIAGQDAQTRIQTEIDGVYSNATDGTLAGATPITICIPRYRIGNVSLTNNSLTAPHYFVATDTPVSAQTVFRVLNTRASITPTLGGDTPVGISSNGMDAWKGKLAVFLGDVSGTNYIYTTRNAGASWVRTQLDGLQSVKARRFTPNGSDWLVAQSGDTLQYSNDRGITWQERTATGSNLYCELFG